MKKGISKKDLLQHFTKKQLLGLYLEAIHSWAKDEGHGTDINISKGEAQQYFDEFEVRLPHFKSDRCGEVYFQVCRKDDSLHDRLGSEEYCRFGKGVIINKKEKLKFNNKTLDYEIVALDSGEFQRVATEDDMLKAYNIVCMDYNP